MGPGKPTTDGADFETAVQDLFGVPEEEPKVEEEPTPTDETDEKGAKATK